LKTQIGSGHLFNLDLENANEIKREKIIELIQQLNTPPRRERIKTPKEAGSQLLKIM
jgi:hypothetical protein